MGLFVDSLPLLAAIPFMLITNPRLRKNKLSKVLEIFDGMILIYRSRNEFIKYAGLEQSFEN